jgi:hypothetical protein
MGATKMYQSVLHHRADQLGHDNLVRHVAVFLRDQQHHLNVRADVVGFPTPERIVWSGTNNGHRADVMSHQYIVEVETHDTIDTRHTQSQCLLFAAYARDNGLIFIVVVPLGFKGLMQAQLLAWGISAHVWEL